MLWYPAGYCTVGGRGETPQQKAEHLPSRSTERCVVILVYNCSVMVVINSETFSMLESYIHRHLRPEGTTVYTKYLPVVHRTIYF